MQIVAGRWWLGYTTVIAVTSYAYLTNGSGNKPGAEYMNAVQISQTVQIRIPLSFSSSSNYKIDIANETII